jgi:membrane protease YdiL (CAAX protease family)
MNQKTNLTLEQSSNRIAIILFIDLLGQFLLTRVFTVSSFNIDQYIYVTILNGCIFIVASQLLLRTSIKEVIKHQKKSRFSLIENILWIFFTVFLNFSLCALYSRRDTPPINAHLSQTWLFLLLAVLTGFYEEFTFRGVFLENLCESSGKVFAVIWTTVLFTFMHGTQFPAPLIFGIMMGCLSVMSGNLLLPIAAHIINDWFGYLITPFGNFLFPQKAPDEVQLILKCSCFAIFLLTTLLLLLYYHFYKHISFHPIKKTKEILKSIKSHKTSYLKFSGTRYMTLFLFLIFVNIFSDFSRL